MSRLFARLTGRTIGWFAHTDAARPALPRHLSKRARLFLTSLEDRTTPTNFNVTNTANSGAGSLRQAILDANAAAGADTITINTSGTAFLSSTLTISDTVTLTKSTAVGGFTVSGGNAVECFALNGAGVVPITMSNFTIANGSSTSGGGISVGDEQLTLDTMVLSGNKAGTGGGGAVRVGASTATLTIRNSTLSGNMATLGGGVYFFTNGGLLVENSTLSGNVATTAVDGKGGGAVYFYGVPSAGGFTVRNSTISGNSAANSGGGVLLNMSGGAALFQNSTITNNIAGSASKTVGGTGGGGVARENAAGGLSFVSTIVSGNTSGNSKLDITDVGASLNANFSAIGANAGFTLSGTSGNNLAFGAALSLGSLANNGGVTLTHALAAGSPAIDAGSNPAALSADGRNSAFPRVAGAAADIGAFEVGPTSGFVVDSTADTVDGNLSAGNYTLREAILLTNAVAGANTITFSPGVFGTTAQTITLGGTELPVTDALTITGPGSGLLTVSANKLSRAFNLTGGSTTQDTITGVQITNGSVSNVTGGGGILSNAVLTLDDVTLSGNSGYVGGGLRTTGTAAIVVRNSTVSGNTAVYSGAGLFLYSASSVLIETSAITNNSTTTLGNQSGGGGLELGYIGAATLRNCTISGNSTASNGGGVLLFSPSATTLIQNCTITGNTASNAAAGVPYGGGGLASIKTSTTISLASTIVSQNTSANANTDIAAAGANNLTSNFSAIGVNSGFSLNGGSSANNLLYGTNLLLGTPGTYGGLRTVVPLLAGSPAINAGSNPAGLVTDARGPGYARVFGPIADIGSFEFQTFVYTVDNAGDVDDGNYAAGQFTLREAVNRANINPGLDSILFNPALNGVAIVGGEQFVSESVSIAGNGVGLTTVSAAGSNRLFSVAGTTVTFWGLTLSGGSVSGIAAGIYSDAANLTLDGVALLNNKASSSGGGLFVNPSTSTTTIRNSTISGNTALHGGGVHINAGGSLLLENSLLSGNTATETAEGNGGGGLYFWGAIGAGGFTIRNSTFAGNSAKTGAAIILLNTITGANYAIQNSTITGNTSTSTTATNGFGGAVAKTQAAGTITLTSTIDSGNTAVSNIRPDISDAGAATVLATFDAIGSGNGFGFAGGSGSNLAFGAILNLAPLANNGGPVQTMKIDYTSAAFNAGSNPAGVTSDGRGSVFARVAGPQADIGSYEYIPLVVDATTDNQDNNYTPFQFTLREAIAVANATPGADTITFSPGIFGTTAKTITLGGSQLSVTDSVTILGPGAGLLTVSGNNLSRVMQIDGPFVLTANISGLAILGGNAQQGAGIRIGDETVTLTNVIVSGNSASLSGGGVYIAGTSATFTVRNSTVSGNKALRGGGIYFYNHGGLLLENSTISGNSTTDNAGGGGLYFFGAVSPGGFTIRNSTIANNTALSGGGVSLRNFGGTAVIQNSTISGNSATATVNSYAGQGGGGISLDSGSGSVTLASSIVSGNSATNGRSDIASLNPVTANFSAVGANAGFSFTAGSGNNLAAGANLNLQPLANYGGPTQIIALGSGSPAIGAGNNAASLVSDGRGFPFVRSFGAAPDIGAYEVQSVTAVVDSIADVVDGDSTAGNFTLREAVLMTNANPGADAITFSPGVFATAQTIVLAGTELLVSESVSIVGPGAKRLTVSGNNLSRVFNFTGGLGLTIGLSGVTVANGIDGGNGGAGVFAGNNVVTLDSVSVRNNVAGGVGGGIRLSAGGNLSLLNSTVSGNSSGASGGGVYIVGTSTLLVRNSTIAANTGTFGGGVGGASTTASTSVLFQNSTITANSATSAGGGVRMFSSTPFTFTSTIVSNNNGPAASPDVSSGANQVTASNSAFGSTTGMSFASNTNNLTGAALVLGPLQDNGGLVPTVALGIGSAAIDVGSNPAGLATDARGTVFSRSVNTTDIGAFEVMPSTIDNTADIVDGNYSTGNFTLREALNVANATPGSQTLIFGSGTFGTTAKTITLNGTELAITDSVTLIGPGAKLLTISGNNASRVFDVSGSGVLSVSFNGMTISGGSTSGSGGGIYCDNENLDLGGVLLMGNTAGFSGGGLATGFSSANITVMFSTISGNSSSGAGGGIYFTYSPNVIIRNSTISGNSTNNQRGGGIAGVSVYAPGALFVQNSTITGNNAGIDNGGGIRVTSGSFPVTLISSIVSGNTGAAAFPDIYAGPTLTTATFSAIGINSGLTLNAASASNLTPGIALNLGTLADNGGFVPTIALGAGSPAIDKGTNTVASSFDARGTPYARSINVTDIGAYEVQNLIVDNTGDTNDGNYTTGNFTLREAIALANAEPGAQTITFSSLFSTPQTITLASSIAITSPVTVTGTGASLVTISGNNAVQIFTVVGGGTTTFNSISLTKGNTGSFGGAISVGFGTFTNITLNDAVVSGNTAASFGGGISCYGVLTLNRCTVSGNASTASQGGGFFARGLVMTNSLVANNSANQRGGGILLNDPVAGTFTIRNSTITGNTSPIGAAINLGYGNGNLFNTALTLQNSTITSNVASGGGAVQLSFGTGTINIDSSIVSGNAGSVQDITSASTVNVNFSAVGNAGGFTLTGGNNLAFGAALNLQPLASNGGPVQTIRPAAGSPVINAGSNPAGLTTDGRGFPFARVSGAAADIGAYEVQPLNLVVDSTADTVDGLYTAGNLTLREAIGLANVNPGADSISFSPTVFATAKTITLGGTSLPSIGESVTIAGPGAKLLTISGNNLSRIFDFSGSTGQAISLSGVTVTGGSAGGGAGILAGNNIVTLDSVAVTGNTSIGNSGGGIRLLTGGTLSIFNSTLSGNSTSVNGGGVYISGTSTLLIRNSTISTNTAANGGGVCGTSTTPTTSVLIQNSTITLNSATSFGGGIRMNTTTPFTIASSIVAVNNGPVGSPDVSSGTSQVTASFSAFGSTTGMSFASSSNNLVGATLILGPLQDNGGPTKTHALGAGSAAINAGSNPAGLTLDQRGVPRAVGQVDIGAVERQAAPTVAGVGVNGGDPQHSRVTSLTVTFNGYVTLAANTFTLSRPIFLPTSPLAATLVSGTPAAGQGRILVSTTFTAGGQTIATLTFATNAGSTTAIGEGVEFGSLSDGTWVLNVSAAGVANTDGVGLAADFNTPGTGTAAAGRIYRLFGDGDGDADVDLTDLSAFRTTFTSVNGDPSVPYNASFDTDNDGDVDLTDLSDFRQRFTLIV